MIRVYNRYEIQAWLIRIFKLKTGKLLNLKIEAVARHFFYAIAWILEGIFIAIHKAATRYHVNDASGDDLKKLFEDTGQELDIKGSLAKGKIKWSVSEEAPDTFQLNADELRAYMSLNGQILYYRPITSESVIFKTGSAIIEYEAESIGDDYNYPPEGRPGGSGPFLATENDYIASGELVNGFSGGDTSEYSDEELREQIQSFYDGLQSANESSVLNAARTIGGVRFTTVIENYPIEGEVTIFVSDENGLCQNEIIKLVKDKINGTSGLVQKASKGYRGLGITYNYQPAFRSIVKMYCEIEMNENYVYDEEKNEIKQYLFDLINSQGFNAYLSNKNFKFPAIKSFRKVYFYVYNAISTVSGILIVNAGNWSQDEISFCYDYGAKTVQFGEGDRVNISEGGEFSVYDADNRGYITISVDPDKLIESNNKEMLTRYMGEEYQSAKSEIMRIMRLNDILLGEYSDD